MSPEQTLISHAIQNVWCEPTQDAQIRLKPHRITSHLGTQGTVSVMLTDCSLPTPKDWYHVWQVGHLYPGLKKLLTKPQVWYSLGYLINNLNLSAHAYTIGGLVLPRLDTYLMYTLDNTLVLAIMDRQRIVDLGAEDVYLHLYTNDYFSTPRANDPNEGTEVMGAVITTESQIATFTAEVNLWRQRKGVVFTYVNGRYVHHVTGFSAQVGDVVEALHDSSVREVRHYRVADLQVFHSELDAMPKYILNNRDGLGDTIDYKDDVDLYLVDRHSSGNYTDGRYYNKLSVSSMRMLTHRDYSIPTHYVQHIATKNPNWGDPRELDLYVYVREAGWHRPLVFEHNRIHDLYRLTADDRLQAMQGTNATVAEWTAAHLESSAYTAIMSADRRDVQAEMVLDAYGYNASTRLLVYSPLDITTEGLFKLPPGLQAESTVYEYADSGALLGWHYHELGIHYVPRDPLCVRVEGIPGRGTARLPTVYAGSVVQLNKRYNYGFYKTELLSGVPSRDWVMAVEGEDYRYIQSNSAIEWLVDPAVWYTAVRIDSHFLSRSHVVDYQDGVLKFTVTADEAYSDGNDYTTPVEPPFGQIDVWLNARPLIQGLDYVIQWPEICILNKQYVLDGDEQTITLRGLGFSTPELELETPAEFGYVIHGQLSHNNRFDVRADKVQRIIVEGRIYSHDELRFSEDDSGVTVPSVRNGAPYQIQDCISPLRLDYLPHEQHVYRERSRAVDRVVSDYLTAYIPQSVFDDPNPIPHPYEIYSPYSSKLIHDLINGIIREEDIPVTMSDQDIMEYVRPYDGYMRWDPTLMDINALYVDIHPHNRPYTLNLSATQWRFYSRAIGLKLPNRINTSKFLTIG